ncbi:MAG TPA: hypothetical protein VEG65_06980 [Candidatus Bathyarchaeia archaeon]|nr:hypothetical protein [Candidatus Bathyarchaeia archaeon]
MALERKITYFDDPGEENTAAVLKIARERAKELGINHILIPSVRGTSAEKALDFFTDTTFTLFFVGTDPARFSPETKQKIEGKGFKLAFYKQVDYQYPDDVKNAFRRFGQGTKVAVELTLIAAQEEIVEPGMEVVALGGSAKGYDTALVLKAATSDEFYELEISEILCKPRKTKT